MRQPRLDAVATELAPTLLRVPLKAEVGAGTGGARAKTLVVGGSFG